MRIHLERRWGGVRILECLMFDFGMKKIFKGFSIIMFLIILASCHYKNIESVYVFKGSGLILYDNHYLIYHRMPCCREPFHSSGCYYYDGDTLFLTNMITYDSVKIHIQRRSDKTIDGSTKKFVTIFTNGNRYRNSTSILVNDKYSSEYWGRSTLHKDTLDLKNIGTIKTIQVVDTVRGYTSPKFYINDTIHNLFLITVGFPYFANDAFNYDWTDTTMFLLNKKNNSAIRIPNACDSYDMKNFFDDTLQGDDHPRKYRGFYSRYASLDETRLWQIKSCSR